MSDSVCVSFRPFQKAKTILLSEFYGPDDLYKISDFIELSDCCAEPSALIEQVYELEFGNREFVKIFTASLDIVAAIKFLFDQNVQCDESFSCLDLCCGSGILSLPLLDKYTNMSLTALDIQSNFISVYQRYIDKYYPDMAKSCHFIVGDVCGASNNKIFFAKEFDYCITNPLFDDVASSALELALHASKKMVVAILPLDVLSEIPMEKSYRFSINSQCAYNQRILMNNIRKDGSEWALKSVYPILSTDRTAQVGIFYLKNKFF